MSNYGVSDIFANVQTTDAMEGYEAFVAEQLDNARFRDMYMDTMESVLLGGDRSALNTPGAVSEDFNELDIIGEGKGCSGGCGSAYECDAPMNGGGIGAGGFDDSMTRSLNMIPESDPTDAGTFFNLSKQRPSVESMAASREIQDLISVAVPDTDLISATESYSVDNTDDMYGDSVGEGPEPSYEGAESFDEDLGMLDIM